MLNPSIAPPQYPGLDAALIARGFPPLISTAVPVDVYIGRIVSKEFEVVPGDAALNADLTAADAWQGDPRFLKWLGKETTTGGNSAQYAMRGCIVGARVPIWGDANSLEYDLANLVQFTAGTGVWLESGAVIPGTPSERLKAYNAALASTAASDINGAGFSPNTPDIAVFADPLFVDFQSQFALRSRAWPASGFTDGIHFRIDALAVLWKSNPVDPTNANEPCGSGDPSTIDNATLTVRLKQIAAQLHAASMG